MIKSDYYCHKQERKYMKNLISVILIAVSAVALSACCCKPCKKECPVQKPCAVQCCKKECPKPACPAQQTQASQAK